MTKRLHMELTNLKKRILTLGTMVEERVREVIKYFSTRDSNGARRIIELDREVDEMEVEIEEECLKILALHQPVASDLRFIAAVIKINNDLERVGDEAVNIAQRILIIVRHPPIQLAVDFDSMASKVENMLRLCLDSLVYEDLDIAYKVCLLDDEIDALNRRNYDAIKEQLSRCPNLTGPLINMLLVSRHLERIADHATNVAEEVIYMIEGEIPRHMGKKQNGI